MAALAAVLGTSLLLCASASAKTAQTITFTSTLPSAPVVGASYEVAATSSSGLPVELSTWGSCSFERRPLKREASLAEVIGTTEPAPPRRRTSPITVYFSEAGACEISASSLGNAEYEHAEVARELTVAKDASERITFISSPPSKASVGGSYVPVVRSSAGIGVQFTAMPRSVCTIVHGSESSRLDFVGAGTCTIDVRQDGVREPEPPEAQQSFKVSAARSEIKKTPPKTEKHRGDKKCKKGLVKRNGKCVKKMASPPSTAIPMATSPEATGTIVIKLISALQPPPGLAEGPAYGTREVRVTRFGPGANASFATWEQTVHGKETLQVPPGEYEVSEEGFSRKVMVAAGQSQEVTLETGP